jgi:sigma-B regulation protein RsbU (phosphoserine phosphatase)
MSTELLATDEVRTGTIRARLREIRELTGISWTSFELLLIAVAVFVYVLLTVVGASTALRSDLVFTMVIGNWTAVLIALTQPSFVCRTFPWNWVIYLPLLLVVGVSGSFVASVVTFALSHSEGTRVSQGLGADVRFGTLITLVFGIITFLVAEQKAKLENEKLKLQGQVMLGEIERKAQAAELDRAHEIQIHLLPRETPQVQGYQIACAWQPAKAVSGDYFDVFPLSSGRMAVCIADVSGKGMGAALLMANLQASVRAFASADATPAQVCERLNVALCSNIAPGKFVTLIYGILAPAGKRFMYANAGHCLPLVVRAGGAAELPETHDGVLGLFAEWKYHNNTLAIEPGDCLLLVTDGVLEASNHQNEEFGYERLISLVREKRNVGAHTLRQEILGQVSKFCEGLFNDDASLIVIAAD